MKTSTAAILATFGLALIGAPAMAANEETNRQSPAPQNTTPPPANAKAQQPSDQLAVESDEAKNNQSPGNSESTDLTKKAETPGTPAPKSTEETNTVSPAPQNNTPPAK